MKNTLLTGFVSVCLLLPATAQEAAEAKQAPKSAEAKQQQELATQNALAAEKLKAELSEKTAEVARIKLEKEALSERLALAVLKLKMADEEGAALRSAARAKIGEDAATAKAKAEALSAQLKAQQAELQLQLAELKNELTLREAKEKRRAAADREPEYLENPLKEDGTLVISDRRIAFNGPVTYATANYITERISFYNNSDSSKPIFIVIDSSPGGSVMAGYRILRAMDGSQAPVYVVVKSFAASMAATIATLAEKSYAYPNAIILHHQISSTMFGSLNLTQQRESFESSQKWWERLAKPIAEKMGLTTDELIKEMYKNSSDGDWTEFGTEAQKLKWIDHIVERIDETSIVNNPDVTPKKGEEAIHGLTQTLDDQGKPVMYLPRLNPADVYWMSNRDQYFRLR